MIQTVKKPATVRVAVYTRKSVTLGLEQEFNTLDAQRESVERFVESQRGQGWVALPERYDDGGYTGANTERPAFRRLLKDIDAGKVDVVCIYRTDRLSRSLLDFAKLMDYFEQRGVALVSVTEAFDTSQPMGRMVLNMLATFAQFERETIAGRTRDKIVASRRRGLWTGGRPPLGYDLTDKKLVINEAEAERVRAIFQLYLTRPSVLAVVDELRERGWTSKAWVGKQGQQVGGAPFSKDTLRHLLSNPVYIGQTRCGDETVKGAHDAILDERTWLAVQARLGAKGPTGPRYRRTKGKALLAGIAQCVCGAALVRHYSAKPNRRRYGYYVCNRAQKHGVKACPGSRIAAGKLEAHVMEQLRAVGRDPKLLKATLQAEERERETKRQALADESRRLGMKRAKLTAERRQVVVAIDEGGPGTLHDRLAEIDEALAGVEQRAQEIVAAQAALEVDAVDPGELRRALAELEPIWSELFPDERARLLGLLIDRVVLDAEKGEIEISFRPGGPESVR